MQIELTTKYAEHILREFQICDGLIKRTIEIIRENFGDKWLMELKERSQKEAKKPDIMLYKHPIYDGMLSGVFNQLTLRLIELAMYIQALKDQDNFKAIIDGLKNTAAFDDFFYQLKISNRLLAIDPELELEKSIGSYPPDCVFSLNGESTLIEASLIDSSENYIRNKTITNNLIQNGSRLLKKYKTRAFIYIKLKNPELTKYYQQIIKNIEEILNNQKFDEEIDNQKFTLEVSPIPSNYNKIIDESILGSGTDYDIGCDFGLAPGKDGEPETYDLDKTKLIGGVRISTKELMPYVEKDIADKMDKKVSSKIKQLKKGGATSTYLFLDLNVYYLQKRYSEQKDRIKKRIELNYFEKYKDLIAGVFITHHSGSKQSKNNINYDFFPNQYSKSTIGRIIHEALLEMENRNSFLIPIDSQGLDRNDPCSCKSGKKYKKCCGKL